MADQPQAVVQDATVELKPAAVEVKQPKEEWKGSDMPYHNADTAKIQESAAKKLPKDAPYKFEANGYTVTKDEPRDGAPDTWTVKADGGFIKGGLLSQASAENYALTHAEAHKDTPATVSTV